MDDSRDIRNRDAVKTPKLDSITFVASFILGLVTALGYAIFFREGAGEQLKTIYAQSVLLALAAVTGYFLNSSADQAKKDELPKPSTTTTTTVIPPEGEQPADGIPVIPQPPGLP